MSNDIAADELIDEAPEGAAFSERVHTYTEYAFYPALVDFTLASV